jgi:hypothetical protein
MGLPRPSPFANVPPDKQGDFRFLLERVYFALAEEIGNQSTLVKGKIGEHEGRINKLGGSVAALEVCPCNKRHAPGETCPLWVLESEVLKNKWRNAGIYSGFFTAGALFYYVTQLVLSYLKVG